MKRFLKITSFVLLAAVLLGASVLAYDLKSFKDFNENHWANTALSDAVDNKLLNGYEDNTLRPDREMTRAEMATIVNRSFGAEVLADVSRFGDLKSTDWFYNEVAKAVRMQTFGGTGENFEASRSIYREEAMAAIARALVLKDGKAEVLDKFGDSKNVSEWAKGSVSALISKGYVNGTNMNLIEPRSFVTRAQFAQIMYNIFSDYIQTAGTYSINAERSLMINVPGVTLKDCTINGDLVLGDGVGRGNVTIQNVKVKGRILIRGGDKVTFKNTSTEEGIVVKNVNGTVNFQNYQTESIFKGIEALTPVTYLQKTPYVPSGPSVTSYTVTFLDGDGSILSTQYVQAGSNAIAPSVTPTKAPDNEWIYGAFTGWDKSFNNVYGNLTISPIFEKTARTYPITLNYGSGTTGTMPATIEVKWNDTLADVLPKTGFENGNMKFDGWYLGNEKIDTEKYSDIAPATNLTAKWIEVFKVNFYNGDGTVMKSEDVEKGSDATAPTETPEKASDNEWSYTFDKWEPDFTNVQTNLDVNPIFTKTDRIYTITLNYGDGTTGTKPATIEVKWNDTLADKLPMTGFENGTKVFEGWYNGNEKIDTEKYSDIAPATNLTVKWQGYYTVNFYNGDGTVMKSESVAEGGNATEPSATPEKAEDDEYTYAFDKWDTDFTNVTSNLDVKPLFTTTDKIYTITLNYGDGTTGTKPATIEVKWNDTLADALPKTGFENGNMKFDGWYNGNEKIDTEKYFDISPVTNLTAKWIEVFKVTFYNGDGTVMKSEDVEKGSDATAPTETPEKASDNEWSYTFDKWDIDFTNVQTNLDVNPVFTKTDRIYTITLNYGDGTTGTKPATIEVKWNDTLADKLPMTGFENGTKVFEGWYNGNEKIDTEKYSDIAPATNLTVKWQGYYTVTFYNGDGTVMKSESVAEGGNATEPSATPEKAEDDEYTYTFDKWDIDFTNVQTNLDVKPLFTTTDKIYTITLNYGSGTTGTMPATIEVKWNDTLADALPKTGFENSNMKFDGWYNGNEKIDTEKYSDISPVTNLTAKWIEVFKVTFYNGDGTVMKSEDVEKGSDATAPTETPEKASDNEWSYTFDKWEIDFTNVQTNLDVNPIFTKTAVEYEIDLVYGFGVIFQKAVPMSITVTYNEKLAPKLPYSSFSLGGHEFDGWLAGGVLIEDGSDITYADVAGITELNAKWTRVYTVTFYNGDGTVIDRQVIREGEDATEPTVTPTKPLDTDTTRYGAYLGWDKTFTDVQSDIEVKPLFEEFERTYVLNIDYNGGIGVNLPESITVTFNETFISKLPSETSITNGNMEFDGWTVGNVEVVGSTTYASIKDISTTVKANWKEKTYTVIWRNYDGSELEKDEDVPYGEMPTYNGATPTKPATAEYTFEFEKWIPDVSAVTGDVTYTATFKEILNTYTVIWKNYDGSELEKDEDVPYGETPTYNGATPTKPATAEYTFEFEKWTPDVSAVTGDVTYTATFKEILNTYTVIWENYDGSELEKDEDVPYGETPTYNGATPTKPATAEYTFEFEKWTPDVSAVTGDVTYTATFKETVKTYKITFVTNNGEDIAPIENVKYGDDVDVRLDLQKTNSFFKGWRVSADGSLITTSPFEFLYEEDITLTAEWSNVYFKVEHYIPDGLGGYTLDSTTTHGADVGTIVYAKDYSIFVSGYALDEEKTVGFGTVTEENDLVLEVYYEKLLIVTFYGWDDTASDFAPIMKVENLKAGDKVTALPDYEETQLGYRTGNGATHSAVNYLYGTRYTHVIKNSWSYEEAGVREEFTLDTEVYTDLDVYPAFKRVKLDIFVKRFEDTFGGKFEFLSYYDQSRIVDSLKDTLYTNKGRVIQAIDKTNVEDKLFEKLDEKGFITIDREILNQEARIKLVTLIGDENLDEFVKTEAEKNVSEDNMTSFLTGYIHDNPDEATELLLDFLHLATQDDIDNIFKPAVKVFLEKDTHLLEEEIRSYIDGLSNDDIKALIEGEPEFVKSFIKGNQDIVVSFISTDRSQIEQYISTNKTTLRDSIDDYITDDIIEEKLRAYIAEKCLAREYSVLNELIGVEGGLYSASMAVPHTTIVSEFKKIFNAEKTNIIAKMWQDEAYKKNILAGDLYATVVIPEAMAKLDGYASNNDYASINALVHKVDSSVNISNYAEYTIARDEILTKLTSASATEREQIVGEVLSGITKSDVESYLDANKAVAYVNNLYANAKYNELNAFFGVQNGIFSSDMSLLGGQAIVTDVIVNTVLTTGTIKADVIDFIYENYFDAAVDEALDDPSFVTFIVGKAVENEAFLNSIIATSVLDTAIDRILLAKDDSVDGDDFDKALDSVVTTMMLDANKSATIDKIIGILFDGTHGDQLDMAVDIVVHDIASSTDPNVLSLVGEFSADVILYLDAHPDKKDILVEMVVEDLYRDTIDLFTKQLRGEEKFTVHDNFSALIAEAMYKKYNGMSIEGFMAEANLPDAFNKVLSKEAIKDIVENIYNNSLTPYLEQLKTAYESFEADDTKTYEVDTFVTVKVDPIDDLVYPLYDEFKSILDEKIGDKHVYADNPYAVALVNFLSPDVLLNKMADGSYDADKLSGYTIPSAEELYLVLYTTAVLADDTGKWYYERIDKDKVDKALDKLGDKIIEYVNCIIGFVNEYKESGEIPNIEDLPDDKIKELLEKYDIQGLVDRNAKIQAIKDKLVANDKFNTVIDKFYNSKFNRELTDEDYAKVKKIFDFLFNGYVDEELTLDFFFDRILSNEKFDNIRVDVDTYEVEAKGNTVTIKRDMFIDDGNE